MDTVVDRLNKSQDIFLATHVNPDGDAIGSLISMGLGLQRYGKHVYLYNESPIPAVYRFLPGVPQVQKTLPPSHDWDAAVILDCGDLDRIGEAVAFVHELPAIINIDHHVTNTAFGDYRLIDATACSSTEIVYRLLKNMGIAILIRALSTLAFRRKSLFFVLSSDIGAP